MSEYDDVKYEWGTFYHRFELLCEINGVSPQMVSDQTEISAAAISLWRKAWYGDEEEELDEDLDEKTDIYAGGTYPSVDSLIKLSLYFNVSVDYLIGIRKSWHSEIINQRADDLSRDNKNKLIEYADFLLWKQENDK